MTSEQVEKTKQLLFPFLYNKTKMAAANAQRFVHYTSATAALQILRSKEFWMREPSCMNDYTEVQHGINCIIKAYNSENTGKDFKNAISQVNPEILRIIDRLFSNSPFDPRRNHFIVSVSEHDDSEDNYGRLSMWRAYGQGCGIGIVLKPDPLMNSPGIYKIQTTPVAYQNEIIFEKEFQIIADNIKNNIDFFKSIPTENFTLYIADMLRFAALATKHAAFLEEREWRLIYSPDLIKSDYMEAEPVTVAGIPQIIYKIPLCSTANGTISGGELPSLIDRIIIGPTQYPVPIQKAFIAALIEAKVPEAEKRVIISGVPLR